MEIVVAEVGTTSSMDQIYRLTFDGSVADEHGLWRWADQPRIAAGLAQEYQEDLPLDEAVGLASSTLRATVRTEPCARFRQSTRSGHPGSQPNRA